MATPILRYMCGGSVMESPHFFILSVAGGYCTHPGNFPHTNKRKDTTYHITHIVRAQTIPLPSHVEVCAFSLSHCPWLESVTFSNACLSIPFLWFSSRGR